MPNQDNAYFTVITKAYLPYARVLMQRLSAVDPASAQYVFLADNLDNCFDPRGEQFRLLTIEEFVEPADRVRLTFQYTAFELSNALKAFAHNFMNTATKHSTWSYYDSDIYPLSSPKALLDVDPAGSVFLTPHIVRPCDRRILLERVPLENALLRSGVYNGGWLGIRRSPEATEFIGWFLDRLRKYCFNLYMDMYVDQLWLNFVDPFGYNLCVVRHPGANIAYWNVHERLPDNKDPRFSIEMDDAIFLHFSGWDPAEPLLLSRYAPGESFPDPWSGIALQYRTELLAAGLEECQRWSYSWECFRNGKKISVSQRRDYAQQVLAGRWPPQVNPFNARIASFRETSPSPIRRLRKLVRRIIRFLS
jgi:hypothetical protein